MKVDLSDVPESTSLAVARLIRLARDGHSGEVYLNLHEGGVAEFREPRSFDADDLREMAREGEAA